MLSSGICGVAYETIVEPDGSLPLLTPMSEVAGRLSVQVGAQYLERPNGGRGILLGGVPGVAPANVAIIGGGVVGTNAAKVATGMGAHVTIIDRSLDRLRQLDDIFNGQVVTLASNAWTISETLKLADLVIGGVLIPGASAPKLVRREMVSRMKRGSVMVDVAIDQGGCFETSHPTTHTDPVYVVDDVLHYCVSNMPAAVPHTSTFALTNATFPYLLELANKGLERACSENPGLCAGVNVWRGSVVYPARRGIAAAISCRVSCMTPLTQLNDEEALFRDTVRRFARERIAPLIREMDEAAVFDRGLLQEFFDLGLMGIEIPEEYGGQGGNFFQCVLAIEEISAVDPSAGVVVDVQNTIVNNAIARWGDDAQKAKYLPRLAAGTVGAYALSEAGSGSDAFALASAARECGDHYSLTGRKLWISNAAEAGLFVLFANADPEAGYKGITAFLVERGFPGFEVGKKEDKLGLRASSTCELILDDCRVPKENVLGERGKGYKIAIETLNEGRIGIGAQLVGLAQGALGHATKYAKERRQFGKAIGDIPGRAI